MLVMFNSHLRVIKLSAASHSYLYRWTVHGSFNLAVNIVIGLLVTCFRGMEIMWFLLIKNFFKHSNLA